MVILMTMLVMGIPPEHIQQGAEVILGETPAKIPIIGVSPSYTIYIAWGQPLTKSIQYAPRAGCRRKSMYSSKTFRGIRVNKTKNCGI